MAGEQHEFNRVLLAIANDMLATIRSSSFAEADWTEGSLEVRWDPGGGANVVKFRLRLADKTVKSLPDSREVTLLLGELWELRSETLANQWYGLRITLERSGECRTDFLYDPECINDPTFFDE